jgi:hypothetical protein
MASEKVIYRKDLRKIIDLSLPAAEIGVAEGLFSEELLSWGVKHLYMVDNWEDIPGISEYPQELNYRDAMERVKPYKGKYTVLRGMSVDMAEKVKDKSLGFLFIDAAHDYYNVMADLLVWTPKVKKGGIVAMHDFLSKDYGVNRATKEFCAGKYDLTVFPDISTAHAGAYFKV